VFTNWRPDPVGAQYIQEYIDTLSSAGGRVLLPNGSYPGFVLPAAGNVSVIGESKAGTIINGSILMQGSANKLQTFTIRGNGQPYGLRVYNGGNPFISRNFLQDLFIGGSYATSGDGPVDGIQLDGAGVFLAQEVTCAFCTGNGLLVDSTGLQPNTTLKFDVCTFNLNQLYGVKLLQSLDLCEFNGGNMEDNGAGEAYCESAAGLFFRGVDFERGGASPFDPTPGVDPPSIAHVLEMENCNSIAIEGCHFTKTAAATRAFYLAGCNAAVVGENRFQGWGANGVFRIAENSANIHIRPTNHIFDGGGWIEDYSR
jgi:hypothetical protein